MEYLKDFYMLKKLPLILFIAASSITQVSFSTEEQSKIHLTQAGKLWSESKFDLAEAEFKKALEENSESPKANAQYAGFLLTQNKNAEAIKIYQKAIILDAENPKLFAALSIAYLHQAKYEMAKAMADEALRLDPEMGAVKKINEYIDIKEDMIKQASKTPKDQLKPNDAMHAGAGHGSASGAHSAATSAHAELAVEPTKELENK